MTYIQKTISDLKRSSSAQAEFYQAVEEVNFLGPLLETNSGYQQQAIIQHMVERESGRLCFGFLGFVFLILIGMLLCYFFDGR